ncbi:unnamed protein product [Adineta ricciae]|uniref:Cyclic nucleotide-binding domain-containing protein n=1 Tax=Adineta ricciae TaxID=249248 RepID=A0A813N341_ADIRI|nr:unnamed protein product [Adineta ricciae]CAF0848339.1 unnamed protein product [Adineta ricciae]
MNFAVNLQSSTFNQTSSFLRLVEHIRRCVHEREQIKQQRSVTDYIDHLKRSTKGNPLLTRALLQFYATIKIFSSQNNRFSSTSIFGPTESKLSLGEKTSVDNLYTIDHDVDLRSSLSDISLIDLKPTKSTTHYIEPMNNPHQTTGLLTKATLNAINKAPHQRSTHDVEILKHLLHNCENLRQLPSHVRHYAARSLRLLTYPPNTIITRQNHPSTLVYIIVSGTCKTVLETEERAILGTDLNIGYVDGDNSLEYRLNGLITSEMSQCNLVVFFRRDLQVYTNYLSDILKQSLLEQLRAQSTFAVLYWRNDIIEYFLKWTKYKQYTVDEIIYGNVDYQDENLYFILYGQISFVCLLNFPSRVIQRPHLNELYQARNSQENEKGITWRFLEVFTLSNGHYFGFEPVTTHAWYLTRTIVDIISSNSVCFSLLYFLSCSPVPKDRFKQLGHFAPMIFEKLREDFLDMYPNTNFIRRSYIKYLQTNQSSEKDFVAVKFKNQKQRMVSNSHEKINWIPEQNLLSI